MKDEFVQNVTETVISGSESGLDSRLSVLFARARRDCMTDIDGRCVPGVMED